MTTFISRRLGEMAVTFVLTSLLCFVIIQLPPNDIVTRRLGSLRTMGADTTGAEETLRKLYNLDKPVITQYLLWVSGFFRGDFGYSLLYEVEVRELISRRLFFTLLVTVPSLVVAYLFAISIGLYSATHQYSILDHVFTFMGMIGLATPSFLFALLMLYLNSVVFGLGVGGLFSPEFETANWSAAKLWDLLKHLWVPMLVLVSFYAAGLIRIMRSRTLDLLKEQFVDTARAKGLHERKVIRKHVFKLAVNPLVSIAGLQISEIISGGVLVAIVLDLPTLGPLLLDSLETQDMFLGGAILMIFIALLLIGNLLSDVTLAMIDPRIRFD